MATGLRIVVADSNHLVRRGLTDVLTRAGAIVVAQMADPVMTLGALEVHQPDVLMVGFELAGADLPSAGTDPGGRGALVRRTRARWPNLAVVVLSDQSGDEAMLAALQWGASAHLARSAPPAAFVTIAVQSAAAPSAFLAEDLVAASRRLSGRGGPRLTTRESQVLELAAEGMTVRTISEHLFVSEATTKSHLSGIYRKLGVTSRSQAVLAAHRMGMIRP